MNTTKQRDLTPQEKFEVASIAFGQILLANSRLWSGHWKSLSDEQIRGFIDSIRKSCDDMADALQEARKEIKLKELTQEQYDAKVAAGKKLKLAPDDGKSPLIDEG